MRRRRTIRPQKAPIFVGCEGQSEVGYAVWLRNCVRDRSLPFHLEVRDLGVGAGDPLTRIEKAALLIYRWERDREPFVRRYLFLDTDQLALDGRMADQARRRAIDHGFTVIWQEPTHEAFLLRHFPGCGTRQPPDRRASDAALAKEWPGYRKPSTAREIEKRLTLDGAVRVAARMPELADLLRSVALMSD